MRRARPQDRRLGWFQRRKEYGPRALGNRSILADPRSAGMKGRINLGIKYREEFRPFCPLGDLFPAE
jgi:carbamoyltransferase